jgi:hypothetical protein
VILAFILSVSAGIVCLAVGIDVGSQVWAEKRAWREAQEARLVEARNLITAGIRLKMARTAEKTIELKVVTLPKKPAHGRHRLVAA